MNVLLESIRCNNRFVFLLLGLVLMAGGCAHVEKPAPDTAEAEKRVETSISMERRGDVVSAIEDLKVALVIDPYNKKALEELNRLIVRRNHEAEQHYRAGAAARDSNSQEARKEFLNALRLNPDHEQALAALRDLQLASSEAIIQARLKKEAARASTKVRPKVHAEEEELDMDTYSLDIAASAFEEGDYATAIREFGKMKVRYPHDPDIQAYLDRSWYNNGITQFNKKNYRKALDSFSKVRKGFDHVDSYIAKCREALKGDSGKKK